MTLTNSNVSIRACVLFLFLMVIVSGCKRTPAVGGEEILPANFEVRVDVTHNSLQGRHAMVDVLLNDGHYELTSFDLKLVFNAEALGFQGAIPGDLSSECNWEYFNYQFSYHDSCGCVKPCGMLQVIATADINQTRPNPSDPVCQAELVENGPFKLFTLDFLVSNDRWFDCARFPIRFYWQDCSDNLLGFSWPASEGRFNRAMSNQVFEYHRYLDTLTNSEAGFPTIRGASENCLDDRPSPVRMVDYISGAVDLVCADSAWGFRGDVNLNGMPMEIADVVMFRDYFIYGFDVFEIRPDRQPYTTDINVNGDPLELSDFVYMIRVISGDAMRYPIWNPVPGIVTERNGRWSVDVEAGAAWIKVEGEAAPALLADKMEMVYSYNGRTTNILIHSFDQDARFNGDFVRIGGSGTVTGIEMVTYDGVPIDLGDSLRIKVEVWECVDDR